MSWCTDYQARRANIRYRAAATGGAGEVGWPARLRAHPQRVGHRLGPGVGGAGGDRPPGRRVGGAPRRARPVSRGPHRHRRPEALGAWPGRRSRPCRRWRRRSGCPGTWRSTIPSLPWPRPAAGSATPSWSTAGTTATSSPSRRSGWPPSTGCPRSGPARASPTGGCCAASSPTRCSWAGGRCRTSSSGATTWPPTSPTSNKPWTPPSTSWAPGGTFDVFELTRRLGHRVGLASWGGPGSARGERFEALVVAFDTLDGSESFVHPDAMAAVAASGKGRERAALAVIVEELGRALHDLPGVESEHALFTRVAEAWADRPADDRALGVALDVALVHVASMSNLFAALGWMVIDLLGHPDELARVRRRRPGPGRGVRARVDPPGAALDHGPLRARARDHRRRRRRARGLRRGDHRHPAPPHQHERRSGSRRLGSRSLEPTAPAPTPRPWPRSSWSPSSGTVATPVRPSPSRCPP